MIQASHSTMSSQPNNPIKGHLLERFRNKLVRFREHKLFCFFYKRASLMTWKSTISQFGCHQSKDIKSLFKSLVVTLNPYVFFNLQAGELPIRKIFVIGNIVSHKTMEQHTLSSVNNCLYTKIYSYLETSGGQSSHLYLNVVHFFNTSFNQTSVAA